MAMKKKTTITKYRCRKCERELGKTNFYETTNPKLDANGLMPICKDCANGILDEYFEIFNNFEQAMLYTCEDLDMVYYESAVEGLKTRMAKAIQNNKPLAGLIGYYKSSLAQNIDKVAGLRFKHSELKENISEDDIKDKVQEMLHSNSEEFQAELEYLEIKWGEGYSEKEYIFLENRFKALTDMANIEYEVDTMLIKQICLEELELRHIRKSKGDTKKKVETIAILMRDANIRPTDIKSANSDKLNDSYGKWILAIEETEPAEYFEDKSLYDDFDGFRDYLKDYVLRPLKNLLKGTRDFMEGE